MVSEHAHISHTRIPRQLGGAETTTVRCEDHAVGTAPLARHDDVRVVQAAARKPVRDNPLTGSAGVERFGSHACQLVSGGGPIAVLETPT